jgi:hypothetical protein
MARNERDGQDPLGAHFSQQVSWEKKESQNTGKMKKHNETGDFLGFDEWYIKISLVRKGRTIFQRNNSTKKSWNSFLFSQSFSSPFSKESYPANFYWDRHLPAIPLTLFLDPLNNWELQVPCLKSRAIESRRVISAILNPIGSFPRNKSYAQALIWRFPGNLENVLGWKETYASKIEFKVSSQANSSESTLFCDPIFVNGLFSGSHLNFRMESAQIQIGCGGISSDASRVPQR